MPKLRPDDQLIPPIANPARKLAFARFFTVTDFFDVVTQDIDLGSKKQLVAFCLLEGRQNVVEAYRLEVEAVDGNYVNDPIVSMEGQIVRFSLYVSKPDNLGPDELVSMSAVGVVFYED